MCSRKKLIPQDFFLHILVLCRGGGMFCVEGGHEKCRRAASEAVKNVEGRPVNHFQTAEQGLTFFQAILVALFGYQWRKKREVQTVN